MRGLYHSVSGHVHSMEGLGERELTDGWFCHVGVASEAEHMLLKSVYGISLRSSVPTKCQPHLHLCPNVLFLYIFLNICIYLVHRT